MIGLSLIATMPVPTCPGGPLFVFLAGTASCTQEADRAIPYYLDNLNSELWRNGWITIGPTVLNAADRPAMRLVNATYGGDPHISKWIDVCPSTLNVSRDAWKRLVGPVMMCRSTGMPATGRWPPSPSFRPGAKPVASSHVGLRLSRSTCRNRWRGFSDVGRARRKGLFSNRSVVNFVNFASGVGRSPSRLNLSFQGSYLSTGRP